MDSFSSDDLCSFVLEEHYGNSSAPIVDCLTILVEHTSGMEAVVVGTTGIAPLGLVGAALIVLTTPGTALVDFDIDTQPGIELVASGIALVALDTG